MIIKPDCNETGLHPNRQNSFKPSLSRDTVLELSIKKHFKKITFWTSKRPKSSPFWWWFSALSLCCSPLSPFIPSRPPKLNLKKPRIRVYYCYRWPPWATLLIYPTSFWWHLDVPNTILTTCWRIWCYFGNMWTKIYVNLLKSIWNLSKLIEASKPRSLEDSTT